MDKRGKKSKEILIYNFKTTKTMRILKFTQGPMNKPREMTTQMLSIAKIVIFVNKKLNSIQIVIVIFNFTFLSSVSST